MESATKYDVGVSVETDYIADQSDEAKDRFVFTYTVTIRNSGTVPAQLISRHWVITDARNQVQEVRGLGVVGAQPLLKPGENFAYTSGTALATPVGTMRGSYQMVAEDGTQFDAEIPEFTLSIQASSNQVVDFIDDQHPHTQLTKKPFHLSILFMRRRRRFVGRH
jgi:ApaG protein